MLLQITKGLIRKPKSSKIKPLGLPMPTPYTGFNMNTRPRGHSDYSLFKEHGKSYDFPKQPKRFSPAWPSVFSNPSRMGEADNSESFWPVNPVANEFFTIAH